MIMFGDYSKELDGEQVIGRVDYLLCISSYSGSRNTVPHMPFNLILTQDSIFGEQITATSPIMDRLSAKWDPSAITDYLAQCKVTGGAPEAPGLQNITIKMDYKQVKKAYVVPFKGVSFGGPVGFTDHPVTGCTSLNFDMGLVGALMSGMRQFIVPNTAVPDIIGLLKRTPLADRILQK